MDLKKIFLSRIQIYWIQLSLIQLKKNLIYPNLDAYDPKFGPNMSIFFDQFLLYLRSYYVPP